MVGRVPHPDQQRSENLSLFTLMVEELVDPAIQGWKTPGFFFLPSPVGFFGFFWVFWVFGFFWVFWVFWGLFYIFAQKREFIGFFPVSFTFRCIQTLNYNHSY